MKQRIFLAILAFFCFERIAHTVNKGFSEQKVHAPLEANSKWEVEAPLTDETYKALSQPYTFLEKGGECYCFLSQDGKYVLKLFKMHHMRPSPLSNLIRPWRENKTFLRNRFFTSCTLAFQRFREETGLVYLQLTPKTHFKEPLTLYSPIGVLHTLDLNTLPFAVQRRADMLYPSLQAKMDEDNVRGAAAMLSSLLQLIDTRSERGLIENDPRSRNFGFIGNRAIEIDIGSFADDPSQKEPLTAKRSFFFETIKLRRWIKKRYPKLLPHFEHEVETRIKEHHD